MSTFQVNAVWEKIVQGQSFAGWKLPHDNKISFLACEKTQMLETVNLQELPRGYVMAPFQGPPVFWAAETSCTATGEEYEALFKSGGSFHYKKKVSYRLPGFSALVVKSQEEMQKNKFEKIVLTRCLDYPLAHLNLWEFFHSLCAKTQTFVSLVSSPSCGTWISASPEILVHTQEGIFRTVALAATQPSRQEVKNILWTQKEIEEQAMVSRYIVNCFKKVRVREYEEWGPRSIHAGHLAHLCTDFKVDMRAIHYPTFSTELLHLLHPTSAVCGMPKENALAFIEANEGYDREFYTGFLGPANGEENHLFVNIRCAQVFEDGLRLYAGAGITAESTAEKEEEEVDLKLQHFLSFLP